MNGMIFAAGLGTRLRPLTDDRPKALVELRGKTLLEHVIVRMKCAGISRVVVNVHHYAGLIEAFLAEHNNFGIDIVISDERDSLLDTGGGLLKARNLFVRNEPVLIHNVDIFSDIDLKQVIESHLECQAHATLVVRRSVGGRVLKFDPDGILKGWENTATGQQKVVDGGFYTAETYSFCGVHIVSPAYLQNMAHQGAFSIIDEYIAQAKKFDMYMHLHDGRFIDLGTPEALEEAGKKS